MPILPSFSAAALLPTPCPPILQVDLPTGGGPYPFGVVVLDRVPPLVSDALSARTDPPKLWILEQTARTLMSTAENYGLIQKRELKAGECLQASKCREVTALEDWRVGVVEALKREGTAAVQGKLARGWFGGGGAGGGACGRGCGGGGVVG